MIAFNEIVDLFVFALITVVFEHEAKFTVLVVPKWTARKFQLDVITSPERWCIKTMMFLLKVN